MEKAGWLYFWVMDGQEGLTGLKGSAKELVIKGTCVKYLSFRLIAVRLTTRWGMVSVDSSHSKVFIPHRLAQDSIEGTGLQ